MKKTAFDMVDIEVDYTRPYFAFPDLSGPMGNPYDFYPVACDALKKNGFKAEALELQDKYKKTAGAQHFNTISRFLDISPNSEVVQEDSEYVYLKVRKDAQEAKQIEWFKYVNSHNIDTMIEEGVDFSEKNIYGRTIFNYANYETLEKLLEKNKEYQWIDLMDFDNFEQHLLISQNHMSSFNLVLKNVIEDYPEMADKIIYVTDVFGTTPFMHANKLLGEVAYSTDKGIQTFGTYLNLIRKVFPDDPSDLVSSYIRTFETIPDFKNLNSNEKKSKFAMLMSYINPEDTSKNHKAIKI